MVQTLLKPGSATLPLRFSWQRRVDALFESDPLTVVVFATDAAQTVLQAGPPSDLPAQVPDFVSDILDAVRNAAGEAGLGEAIRELTPGRNESAAGAANGPVAGAGAENTSNSFSSEISWCVGLSALNSLTSYPQAFPQRQLAIVTSLGGGSSEVLETGG